MATDSKTTATAGTTRTHDPTRTSTTGTTGPTTTAIKSPRGRATNLANLLLDTDTYNNAIWN